MPRSVACKTILLSVLGLFRAIHLNLLMRGWWVDARVRALVCAQTSRSR